MTERVKFNFSHDKAIEALVYIASRWQEITQFYASKVLFFAEREHLRLYQRPITGDSFQAWENGPVPREIYRFIKAKGQLFGDQAEGALTFEQRGRNIHTTALRAPDLDELSVTDVECIDRAIEYCRDKSFGVLSDLSHEDEAWKEAYACIDDDYMDPVLMLDPDSRDEQREHIADFAAYGVL